MVTLTFATSTDENACWKQDNSLDISRTAATPVSLERKAPLKNLVALH